jgi:hypothetical protein
VLPSSLCTPHSPSGNDGSTEGLVTVLLANIRYVRGRGGWWKEGVNGLAGYLAGRTESLDHAPINISVSDTRLTDTRLGW